ncbi:MAG TPA: MFS transporter [Gemmatimonadaceae bacterium]|nr:MFS transporter [Gemmatimonadaceae bacterium]
MRSRPSVVTLACLGMATFGIVLTTLGASLPNVMVDFGIDKAQGGALLSLLTFGVLAGSLVFGPIVDSRGYKPLLVFAFAAIIIGLEATAFAPSITVLRASVLVIGFSGGLVNGALNAVTADVSGEQRAATLTFVGAFFGVGAAGVPLMLFALSGVASHASILASIAPLIVVPLILTVAATFPPSKQPHGLPLSDVRQLASERPLLLMGLILFIQSGVESTVGGWTTTFFAEELGVGADHAALYLALFWFGLLLGRLTLGRVLRRVPAVRVVLSSITLALVSVLLLIASRNVTMAAIAVFLLGCGFSPTFPVIFGFAGDRYARTSGTAIGLIMGIALFGGILLPFAAGVIGDLRGMRASLLVVPACLLLQAALLPVLSRAVRPDSSQLTAPVS